MADWLGASVVVEPVQLPEGEASDSQVGPVARVPAGVVWVSSMPDRRSA